MTRLVDDPRYPAIVTVACANFASIQHDKPATVAKMGRRIAQAARQGSDLILFPELSLNTVGNCDDCAADMRPCRWHLDEAETVPGPSTEAIAELAAKHGIHVVFGLAERDPDDPGRLYNSAALIAPDGIVGTYRKLHLGHPTETMRYTPGDTLPVWNTKLGPIGILICYDFWSNPELSRILAMKGARLLLNPTRSLAGPGKTDYVRNTTVVRAQENLVYAASANWTGAASGAGHSTIAGPAYPQFNKIYAEAGTDEALIIASLNFPQLGAWRDLFPWTEWRSQPERQLDVTTLVAAEFRLIADDARMSKDDQPSGC